MAGVRIRCRACRVDDVVFSDVDTMTALKTPDAGIEAARTTLVELGKAVVRGRVDAGEPLLAPAFVQAAKNLVERRLIAPALSAVTPARHLNASVRTFQRAFVLSVLWRIC